MSDPSQQEFRSAVGTTFRIVTAGNPIILRLAEVTQGRTAAGFEQFSLLFHGPPDRLLEQGTYDFEHDTLGPMALFIVPILESNAERIVYEAAFSRAAPKG